MSAAQTTPVANFDDSVVKVRRAAQGHEPGVLTDIYRDDTNIAIWQRQLPAALKNTADGFLTSHPNFQASVIVTPENVHSCVTELLNDTAYSALGEDITTLVDMFCCLFELRRTGLRLTALDSAMCPKFHVDKVPCRLVTTFHSIATQWLPHQAVNRDKLSAGSNGKPDSQSGLYASQRDIHHLGCGDVALLKGELWEGNENAGLVHRSPTLKGGERRLLLTLDFSR